MNHVFRSGRQASRGRCRRGWQGLRAGGSVPKQFAQWRAHRCPPFGEADGGRRHRSIVVAIPENWRATAESLAGISDVRLGRVAPRQLSVRAAPRSRRRACPGCTMRCGPDLPESVIAALVEALPGTKRPFRSFLSSTASCAAETA
jgi:2-C-methyl-D-erythritol 4-phosphate cytidylyltransferase/2-C-methyl-D-erythritol 2,4-cyclodiphosphate synthase